MRLKLRLAVVLLMTALSPLALGQDLQDKIFDSNGVRIRYVEQGAGEPVVLIHGFGATSGRWVNSKVFQQLTKGYRVIAFDCRGHGKSDKPHDPKQYGQEMALDVVRLLDHLKIDRAHIVGGSMGGFILAKLLTMKPERFVTATLVSSGGILAPTESGLKFFEQLGADMEKGSSRGLQLALAPKDQPLPTEEEMKQKADLFFRANDSAALAAVARSYRDLAITEAQVAKIKVPTIAIIGSDDPLQAEVNKLKSAMPQLKVVSVEKATHRDVMDPPESIAALLEFLKANPIKK